MAREQGIMAAELSEARLAIERSDHGWLALRLLTGEVLRVSIAPNGRDIIVIPHGEEATDQAAHG